MSKIKSTLSKSLPVIIVSVMITTAIIYAAWQEPKSVPPNDNVPAPINVGPLTQSKAGAFGVSGVFTTDNATFLAVIGSGVNIGATTTPQAKLEVMKDLMVSASNPFFYLNGTWQQSPNRASIGIRSAGEVVMNSNRNNPNMVDWEIKYGSGTYPFPNDAFYISRKTSPTSTPSYYMLINSSGNVGIGTTAPQTKLTVYGNTSGGLDNTARFQNTTIGPNPSHIHYGYTGDWYIRSASSTGKVIIQDTGGNVGIGTANPGNYGNIPAKLDINGNVAMDDIWLKNLSTNNNIWLTSILKSLRVGPPGCKNILTTSGQCETDQRVKSGTGCNSLVFMNCDGTEATTSPNVPHICATKSLIDGSYLSNASECSKSAIGCLPSCDTSPGGSGTTEECDYPIGTWQFYTCCKHVCPPWWHSNYPITSCPKCP
jgi:hypothetical protein